MRNGPVSNGVTAPVAILDPPATTASGAPTLGLDGELPELSRLSIVAGVCRRCGPHLLEATIVPAVLFYGCLMAGGLGVAYVAALGWSYAALGRRALRRQPIPPILVLGVIGITVKTGVAVVSQSSFLYFFQPILGTVAMAGVFFGSVAVGRPLIGRLAVEFWPLTAEAAARPGVLRLFRGLTLLWGAANLASAAMTLGLLVWLPLEAFLPLKQVASSALTAATVFVTVSVSLRTARREGLVSAHPRRSRRPVAPEPAPAQLAAS